MVIQLRVSGTQEASVGGRVPNNLLQFPKVRVVRAPRYAKNHRLAGCKKSPSRFHSFKCVHPGKKMKGLEIIIKIPKLPTNFVLIIMHYNVTLFD